MKYSLICLIIFLCLVFISGCDFAGTAGKSAELPGFMLGIWHGLLAPYTLIIRFFLDIKMYEVLNAGVSYDLGFLIGVGGALPFGWIATMIALIFHFGLILGK